MTSVDICHGKLSFLNCLHNFRNPQAYLTITQAHTSKCQWYFNKRKQHTNQQFFRLPVKTKKQNLSTSPKQKNQHKISIFHQFIAYLPSRIDILNINLQEIKPDIVALCEHKMSETEISRLNIENYIVCSSFSRKLTTGGGVVILSRKNVTCKKLCIKSIEKLATEKEFECCLAIVKADKMSFVIACLYRSPQSKYEDPFLNKLEILMGTILKKHKNLIIVGDLNINVLDHDSTYLKFSNILK